MRNKYPGKCYRCGKIVDKLKGHFERNDNRWILFHSECIFKRRREQYWNKRIFVKCEYKDSVNVLCLYEEDKVSCNFKNCRHPLFLNTIKDGKYGTVRKNKVKRVINNKIN